MIYLANYECDNDFIDKPGWKKICSYVNKTKKTNRIIKDAKAKHPSNTVNTKYGMNINRENREAMILDSDNGNTNWKDADIL